LCLLEVGSKRVGQKARNGLERLDRFCHRRRRLFRCPPRAYSIRYNRAGVTVLRNALRRAQFWEHLTWRSVSLKLHSARLPRLPSNWFGPQLHCSKSISLYFMLEDSFAGFKNFLSENFLKPNARWSRGPKRPSWLTTKKPIV